MLWGKCERGSPRRVRASGAERPPPPLPPKESRYIVSARGTWDISKEFKPSQEKWLTLISASAVSCWYLNNHAIVFKERQMAPKSRWPTSAMGKAWDSPMSRIQGSFHIFMGKAYHTPM